MCRYIVTGMQIFKNSNAFLFDCAAGDGCDSAKYSFYRGRFHVVVKYLAAWRNTDKIFTESLMHKCFMGGLLTRCVEITICDSTNFLMTYEFFAYNVTGFDVHCIQPQAFTEHRIGHLLVSCGICNKVWIGNFPKCVFLRVHSAALNKTEHTDPVRRTIHNV